MGGTWSQFYDLIINKWIELLWAWRVSVARLLWPQPYLCFDRESCQRGHNTCQIHAKIHAKNEKRTQKMHKWTHLHKHLSITWRLAGAVLRIEKVFIWNFVVFRCLDGKMISTKRPKIDIQAVSFNWRVFRDCLFFLFFSLFSIAPTATDCVSNV